MSKASVVMATSTSSAGEAGLPLHGAQEVDERAVLNGDALGHAGGA